MSILVIHEQDNVAVVTSPVKKGENVRHGHHAVVACEDIDRGHKMALRDIATGVSSNTVFPLAGRVRLWLPAGGYTRTI